MAEGTDASPRAGFQERKTDGKISTTAVTVYGTSAAGGAATILYLLGCIKGHQFYPPDDALALFWAGLLAPAAKVLYDKFNRWAGVVPVLMAMILVGQVLSGCAASPPPSIPATPQQKFDRACTYARETWTIARPIAGVPKVANAIGESGALAVKALNTLVVTTCTQPLDVADSAAVTQRIYDVAGQVVALVIDAISR